MNFSLPIYFSKENLTTRFVDYSNTVFLPSICFFGMLTSIGCIVASFKKDESQANIINFIFINSLIDFFFLLAHFFVLIIRCGSLCPYSYSYFSKFYQIYVFWFASYSLLNSQVLFSIYIAYDRLQAFSARIDRKNIKIYRVFGICVVIGTLLNILPYAISKEVVLMGVYVSNNGDIEYLYDKNVRSAFSSQLMNNLITALLTFSNPVLFMVFVIINILVLIRFRYYLNKKKSLTYQRSTGL